MNGPEPLSTLEVKAWLDLMGEAVLPEEFAILRVMDQAYRAAAAIEIDNNQAKTTQ